LLHLHSRELTTLTVSLCRVVAVTESRRSIPPTVAEVMALDEVLVDAAVAIEESLRVKGTV
jgi:hypothetical protein